MRHFAILVGPHLSLLFQDIREDVFGVMNEAHDELSN